MEDKFVYNLESFFMELQIESLRNFREGNFEYDSMCKSDAVSSDEWKKL